MSKDIAVINETKTSLESLFEQAQILMDRKMVPTTIKKPEDVVNIIQIGESLGMNPSTALNSIDMIQGNIAIKAKIIPGLLAKHGVAVQVIKDYEPIIEKKPVYMKDANKKPILDDDGNPKIYTDPITKGPMIKEDIVDYITTVSFKRNFPNIGVIENFIDFKWSDAVDAGWDSKPNWKKMPRYMMMARCITRGARIVASDIIGGLYDNYEVSEFTNQEISEIEISE